MKKTKTQRKIDGPGWFEVIFGAALSVALGVVLAAAFFIFKPVTTVKELPKEPEAKMVYYIQGTRDSSKTREVSAKRRLLVEGQAVALNEDELNTLVMPPTAAPKPRATELPQPAAESKHITPGLPNFRIRDSLMQVAVPIKVSAFETDHELLLQTRGNFSTVGDVVTFQPGELYLGSLPLEKLPAVKELVLKHLVANTTVPEELSTAWRNMAEATVDGSMLRLTPR
jgi:hypothetical protein